MEIAIGEKFGIDPALFKGRELKPADVQLLIDEKAVVMVKTSEPWPSVAPEVKDANRIKCWEPEEAKAQFKAQFLERFEELSN